MSSAKEQSASSLAEAQRRAHEASVLLEIAQTAGSTLNLNEVLDRVVERTASLTGADRCSIWLLDPGHEHLLPAALYGMDPAFTIRWKRRPLALKDERLSQEVVSTGRPVIVWDAETDARTDKQAVALFGDKSILVVPLLTKGRVIGTLFLNHVGRPYQYTDQDVAITSAIASQAAVAIEHAQLYEETRRKSDELLAAFRRIGDALATGRDVNETLQLIVELATEIVHGAAGSLQLLDENGELVVRAACGLRDGFTLTNVAERSLDLAREVVRRSVPVHLRDSPMAADLPPGARIHGFRSYLGVPLRLRGVTVGTLVVGHPKPGRFSPVEIELLASFANQAAVALDNAQLLRALQAQVAELRAAVAENHALLDRLEHEKEQLDAIFRNTSDAIFLMDAGRRIVAFNPAAEHLSGIPAASALGLACWDLFNCGFDGRDGMCHHNCPMLQVLRERKAVPYVEAKLQFHDGRTRDVAASYSFIPSGADGGFGVAIVRDISHLKEVERLKSDFVSMVSHELRTPLSVIKGYAATLLNPTLNIAAERQHRFLRGINDASDRLTRLIDNLLSVSRLESGRFRLNPQHFDLAELLKRLVIGYQAQSPRHRFVLDFGDGSLWLRADRDQIELVLANLVGNAVKYSPDGRQISIEARRQDEGLLLQVRDEGLGISAEQISHIFEKFFRGDAAKEGRVAGTGLGLYICKSIVEAHGGQIWVESIPRRGSTFSLLIPFTPRPVASTEVSRTSAQSIEGVTHGNTTDHTRWSHSHRRR